MDSGKRSKKRKRYDRIKCRADMKWKLMVVKLKKKKRKKKQAQQAGPAKSTYRPFQGLSSIPSTTCDSQPSITLIPGDSDSIF